jgi:hypothetical protein
MRRITRARYDWHPIRQRNSAPVADSEVTSRSLNATEPLGQLAGGQVPVERDEARPGPRIAEKQFAPLEPILGEHRERRATRHTRPVERPRKSTSAMFEFVPAQRAAVDHADRNVVAIGRREKSNRLTRTIPHGRSG